MSPTKKGKISPALFVSLLVVMFSRPECAAAELLRVAGVNDDLAPYQSLQESVPPAAHRANKGQESNIWRDLEWLQQQPGSHFTIQLMAGGDVGRMRAFAIDNKLPGPVVLAPVRAGSDPLYVLVQGSYASLAKASNAARTLPVAKPWIRPFSSLQRAVVTLEQPTDVKQATPTGAGKDIAWIWSRIPEHYAIQLKVAGSERSLVEVVAQYPELAPLAIVAVKREGNPRYILIQGDYAGYADAQAGLKKLPEPLQQDKPWARRYSTVHDELSHPGTSSN